MKRYCLSLKGENIYRVRVPTLKKGEYEIRDFSHTKHMFPKEAAIRWQNERGLEIWGRERWNCILSEGSVRMYWGKGAINVYEIDSTWSAFWRENGKPMCKSFDDEKSAKEFARKKRTELAFKAKSYTNEWEASYAN